jgi:hypothetical protein
MRTLHTLTAATIVVATGLGSASVRADAVTDWNRTADELITAAKMAHHPRSA